MGDILLGKANDRLKCSPNLSAKSDTTRMETDQNESGIALPLMVN